VAILSGQVACFALAKIELANELHAVGPGERTPSMLQIVLPLSQVTAAIGKFEDTLSILQIVPELALVRAAVRVAQLARTRALPVVPGAIVLALVGPAVPTAAVAHIFVEFAIV